MTRKKKDKKTTTALGKGNISIDATERNGYISIDGEKVEEGKTTTGTYTVGEDCTSADVPYGFGIHDKPKPKVHKPNLITATKIKPNQPFAMLRYRQEHLQKILDNE